ncbi:hypothetical protein AU476_07945 [Cupriavidus sp. UYMSc13B]|nr:hypothetical protein AU476_07945 [Cupriavidus sp. UYMSc13B]
MGGGLGHALAVFSIASMILVYPVQRQMLPAIAKRISSRVGFGFASSSALAATTKPGVQNPHCAAPQRMNCSWIG